MEYKNIECAYEIYKQKGHTNASKKLFTSQSSVTKRLKKLESDLDFDIFNRNFKEIRLTSKGEEFINDAETLINMYNNILSFYKAPKDTKYIISSNHLNRLFNFNSQLNTLKENHNIDITFIKENPLDSINNLILGKINFTLLQITKAESKNIFNTLNLYHSENPEANINYKVIHRSNLYVQVKETSPLYSKKYIDLNSLQKYKLIKIKNKNLLNQSLLKSLCNSENSNILQVDNIFEAYTALNESNYYIGTLEELTMLKCSNIKSFKLWASKAEVLYLYAYSPSNNSLINKINETLVEKALGMYT